MKRFLTFLLSLFALAASARAQQLNTSSNIIGSIDTASFGTQPYYFVPGYLTAALDLVYPNLTNFLANASGSGKTMEQQVTNSVPLFDPPVWSFATSNHVTPVNLVMLNDNGDYTSNSLYPFGVHYYSVPSSLYNGTAYTNEGFSFSVRTIFLGHYVGSGGAASLNYIDRNACGMELNSEIGVAPIDLWHDVWTNGLSAANYSSLDGSEFYYALNHVTQKNAFFHVDAMWRGLGLKTNLCAITFNVGGGSVSSSNGIAAVSVSLSGGVFSATIKQDCMALRGNVFPTVSNNVSTTLWTNCPAFGNLFTEYYQFTNLNSAHLYVLAFDGHPVATNSGAAWAVGVNMATNYCTENPFVTQSTTVLYDICAEYGMNPTNGLVTHSAGENGPLGPDLINYGSLVASKWPAEHGPTLVDDATVQTDVTSMWGYAVASHNDAQQTSHALTLTDIPPRFAPFHR